MKLTFLAAAALLASPALAQQNVPGTAQGDAQKTPGDSPSSTMSSMPAGQTSAPAGDPAGGYQPSTMGSPPPAGATVTYQQAPSPDQAYPAPAPMAKYPMCKPGQYDNCMQGSGAHKMAAHRTMRHHKK